MEGENREFINKIDSHLVPLSYNNSIAFKNHLPAFCILVMTLFQILLQKYYPIRLSCVRKHSLAKSCEVVLSVFYTSVLIDYLMKCSTLIIFSGVFKLIQVPSLILDNVSQLATGTLTVSQLISMLE